MKFLLTAFMTGILLLYPFAIYFGLNYFSATDLAIFLLTILLVRIGLVWRQLEKMPWLLPATILGAIAILFSIFSDTSMGFKLYPLAVNFAMLIVFGFSYFNPPSVIESIARLTEKDFSENAVSYTHNVTLAWCVFFVFNAAMSAYTALFSSLETWMIYNGFLSYILIGLFMGVEYLVRIRVKKQHQQSQNNGTTIDE